MKTNKNYPLFATFGIVIGLSIIIVILLLKLAEKKEIDNNFLSEKIENFKDQLGQDRAKIITSTGVSEFRKSEFDSLRNALALAKKDKINAITEIKGILKDSLKLLSVSLDAEKNKVWEWEKKYNSGSTLNVKMSEKDSTLKTELDLVVQSADVETGAGKKKKFYTEFYTPDQNIKFNGARTYRVEQKEIRDILQLDLSASFQKGMSKNFDALQSTIDLNILPDADFNFSIGIGGAYQIQEAKIYPFGQVTLKKNLFRIKGR